MAFAPKAYPLPLLLSLLANPVQPGPRALSLSITPPGSHPGRWLVITCQPDSPRGNLTTIAYLVVFGLAVKVIVGAVKRGRQQQQPTGAVAARPNE